MLYFILKWAWATERQQQKKKKIKRKEDQRLDSENTYKSKNSIVIKMNTIFLGFHFRARKKRASNYQCSNGYGLSFIGTQHVHQELRRLRPWPSRTPRRWRPTVSFTLPALCLRMWTLPHMYLAHFTSLCYPKHYFYFITPWSQKPTWPNTPCCPWTASWKNTSTLKQE